MTRWLDPQPVTIPASLADLSLPPLIAQTLVRRGITDAASARSFLHPNESPSTPFPGIQPAIDRIGVAIRSEEIICVWGDFDVDGQTSTALLVQTLQSLDANVVYYIPIRGKESHGVHIASLKPILDNGAKLVITCDTGITAFEAIDYANSRGVDVIVTDHHDPGATLPNAHAIMNPKLLPQGHPLANLAGVGVAYKLAEALLEAHPSSVTCYSLLDLVALGLIADVALLKGETRSLVQQGIQVLRNTSRLGLRVMAELSGTTLESINEETIGFTFAPRLNALGRLGDANPSVELLTVNDPVRARVLVAQIEGLNAQRKLLTSQVYEAAQAQLDEKPELLAEPAIMLTHPSWPGGVVGIVANKLVERYHKPAILMNESDEGILRGSARSIEGLHITEAITTQKGLLISFGGHPMAAGLALQKDRLPQFRKGLARAIEGQLGKAVHEEPRLQIDAWLKLDELNLGLAESLESLAPFGPGNPSLRMATRDVKLKSLSTLGKTREHARLNIEDGDGNVQSVLWWGGAGEELPEGLFDIAYSVRASTFRAQKQLTVQFEDFRVREEQAVEVQKPEIEILDYRLESPSLLGKLKEHTPSGHLAPSLQIWAEGAEKSKGSSRFDLQASDEFAIYTTPPSPAELRKALEVVQPKKIYVFAVQPAQEGADQFLNRLAGLCKYALNHRGGKTTVQELAVAMAAREGAIQLGLEWLAAGGHLTVEMEEYNIHLLGQKPEPNPYLQAELYVALKGILNETAAYRKYFATVSDAKSLVLDADTQRTGTSER